VEAAPENIPRAASSTMYEVHTYPKRKLGPEQRGENLREAEVVVEAFDRAEEKAMLITSSREDA